MSDKKTYTADLNGFKIVAKSPEELRKKILEHQNKQLKNSQSYLKS